MSVMREENTEFELDGYFEEIDVDLNASGWAVGHEVTLSVIVDGVVASQGVTSIYRPDLISEGVSTGAAGFKLKIPRNAIGRLRTTVDVAANETILNGGSRILDLTDSVTLEVGDIEAGVLNFSVTGWPGRAILANILVDGEVYDQVKIPAAQDHSSRAHPVKISWPVPEEFCDGVWHAYSLEIDHDVSVVRSGVKELRYPDYKIHIDALDFYSISGWVYRGGDPSSVCLRVTSDGKDLGSAVADQVRRDVSQALGVTQDRVGFHIRFKHPLRPPSADISIFDDDRSRLIATVSLSSVYEQLSKIAADLARGGQGAGQATVLSRVLSRLDGDLKFDLRPVLFGTSEAGCEDEVAVIVPVYGGAMETTECIESVLRAVNDTPMLLVLVNDASPDPLIRDYLRHLEKRNLPKLRILHRKTNQGFSASVNLGMIASGQRDVILLNADTVVSDHWIDKIVAAARQDGRISTVTPLSNNGEIVTVPYMCKTIPIETLDIASAVDHAAGRVNAGQIMDLPVAIGFCMFIRRESLNDIGMFDAARWGRGYGEEVDFCLKASARGWRHVLAADTFVVHRGSVSFGDEKLERIIESAKKINEAYPFYEKVIHRFLGQDPVAAVRRPLNIELASQSLPEKRILHVTHDLGGGTDRYVKDLSQLYEDEGYTNIVLRFSAKGDASLELTPGQKFGALFQKTHIEKFDAQEIEEVLNCVDRLGVDEIHLHSPIGITPSLLSDLLNNRTFSVTIHDYAWVCPSVTFTTRSGVYFGHTPNDPSRLLETFAEPFEGLEAWAAQANGDIRVYRKTFEGILQKAKRVICAAQDVADRFTTLGLHIDFHIAPHPMPEHSPLLQIPRIGKSRRRGEAARIAIIGGLSDIKGYKQFVSCAKYAEEMDLPLSFVIFGYSKNDEKLKRLKNTVVTGRYKEDEIRSLLAQYSLHGSFFPNEWPETFSYTLSIAMKAGLWPVVSNLGAPAERVKKTGFGTIYERGASPAEICQHLLEAAEQKYSARIYAEELYPETLVEYFGPITG